MEREAYVRLYERQRALNYRIGAFRNYWWQATIPSGYDWSVVTYKNNQPNTVIYVTHIFSQSNYASLQCVDIQYNGASIYTKAASNAFVAVVFPLRFVIQLKYNDEIKVRTWKPSDESYEVFGCMNMYRVFA